MAPDPEFETERKFLVRGQGWRGSGTAVSITQGYLTTSPEKTIRIRIQDDRAVLTVKGASKRDRRLESESDLVDVNAAKTMIACFGEGSPVDKIRHVIDVNGFQWELDEFLGPNAGLVMAELEAPAGTDGAQADAFFTTALDETKRPAWLGAEVTTDWRYANSRLAQHPFGEWTAADRAAMDELREA